MTAEHTFEQLSSLIDLRGLGMSKGIGMGDLFVVGSIFREKVGLGANDHVIHLEFKSSLIRQRPFHFKYQSRIFGDWAIGAAVLRAISKEW